MFDAIVATAAGLPFASVTLGPPLDVVAAGVAASGWSRLTWWRRPRRPGHAAPGESPSAACRPAPTPATAAHGLPARVPRRPLPSLVARLARARDRRAHRRGRRSPSGRRRATGRDPDHGPRRRPGRRDPRRGRSRRPDAGRRRAGPGSSCSSPSTSGSRRGIGGSTSSILTHPHEDHVAGLPAALERYRVGRVFEPGMIGPGPGYAAWRPSGCSRGGAREPSPTGDGFALDEIALPRAVARSGRGPRDPPDGGTAINNVSIVLLGEVDGRRFLLTGDVEEGIDPSLLTAACPTSTSSRSPTTAAGPHRPQPSSTPCGPASRSSRRAGNPYGHPAPDDARPTRGRAGRGVYRTDLNGTVDVGPRRATARRSGRGRPGRPLHGPTPSVGRRGRRERRGLRERPPPSRDRRHSCCAIAGTAAGRPAARPSKLRRRSRPGRSKDPGYHRSDDRPGRVEAASLLLSLDPPPWPCATRAPSPRSPAGWRCGSTRAGSPVERRLVEAAALLHDIDKMLPSRRSGRAPSPTARRRGLADPSRATRSSPERSRTTR